MTNLDQFESVFKSAEKPQFELQPVRFGRVLIATDATAEASEPFCRRTKQFLSALESDEAPVDWRLASKDDFESVGDLLQEVGKNEPDLIVTYRNLHLPAREYPYSLGVHLDVLTQATKIPVLVAPHPVWLDTHPESMQDTKTVMAITDHVTQDHHLVSAAARLTAPGGALWLTHVEDQSAFDRYVDAISRIPSIDTQNAREKIITQLLKEPAEYIASCRGSLEALDANLTVEEEVTMGRLLTDYTRLIDSHAVSLLVMNTKDDQQLAMHGMAYPLTVEMRQTPLLLL